MRYELSDYEWSVIRLATAILQLMPTHQRWNPLIDSPSPFDTLAKWERHLKEVQAWPDNAALKQNLIERAQKRIAEKLKRKAAGLSY